MRLCSSPGCGRAVPNDVRYCGACKPSANSFDGIRSHNTADRESYARLYASVRWTRLRALVVRSQPLCARCRKSLSVIVDHIVPAGVAVAQVQASGQAIGKYAGFYLRSNLQGLCRSCHAAKTIEDKAHTGEWPNVLERDSRAIKRVYSF